MTEIGAAGQITQFAHSAIRVVDVTASVRFYEALGFERRGKIRFDTAFNVYLGLPGGGPVLELTVNDGRVEPYEIGTGFGHLAFEVDELDGLLERLRGEGILPEGPPFSPGGRAGIRICFFQDPDGYRIELIDGRFTPPQDE